MCLQNKLSRRQQSTLLNVYKKLYRIYGIQLFFLSRSIGSVVFQVMFSEREMQCPRLKKIHVITCETNTGEVYRGKLIEAEDNMNCQMSNITVTYRDGRVAQLEQVYIRGSKIRFLILPDMLKNAPMLKSMKNKNQGSGAGRGKAAILKAQVAARGRGRGMGRGNIFQKRR